MCGEKLYFCALVWLARGSPPHVRGKGIQHRGVRVHGGITPACAGKSPPLDLRTSLHRDHPRMCGEKLYTPCIIAPNVGSPPHVRGKAACSGIAENEFGITPACAGKSKPCKLRAKHQWDHPRMCGEKAKYWMQGREPEGSPPHVRGKEYLGGGRYHVNRITPACAGKRFCCLVRYYSLRDHPRMCGEKTKKIP